MSRNKPPAGSWFKSSRSNATANCVETRFDGGTVQIRDSKYVGDPAAQPIITVTAQQWAQFLDLIAGRSSVCVLSVVASANGSVTLTRSETALTSTPAEWDAFTAGAALGEFTVAA